MVDFATRLKQAAEVVESLEKKVKSESYQEWLESGFIIGLLLRVVLKAFRRGLSVDCSSNSLIRFFRNVKSF
ncbi:hypothetical protein Tco_0592754, partial [Tanacetum coccineum]